VLNSATDSKFQLSDHLKALPARDARQGFLLRGAKYNWLQKKRADVTGAATLL
jgi:hypothetical protein